MYLNGWDILWVVYIDDEEVFKGFKWIYGVYIIGSDYKVIRNVLYENLWGFENWNGMYY